MVRVRVRFRVGVGVGVRVRKIVMAAVATIVWTCGA